VIGDCRNGGSPAPVMKPVYSINGRVYTMSNHSIPQFDPGYGKGILGCLLIAVIAIISAALCVVGGLLQ